MRVAFLRVLNWSVAHDLLEVSPLLGLERPAELRPRERVLSEEELKKVWPSCPRGTRVCSLGPCAPRSPWSSSVKLVHETKGKELEQIEG